MDNSKKSGSKPLTRREEREQALGFVFESIFRDDETQDAFDDAFDARDIKVGSYAERLIKGVKEHKDEMINEMKSEKQFSVVKIAMEEYDFKYKYIFKKKNGNTVRSITISWSDFQ